MASFSLMDTHAGGDVSRIVTGGIKPLPGDTVRAQMEYLRDQADGLRRLLLTEPHGIPEMSVDLLVPACDPQAAAGYIIMEVMGYPIYSGSNTLCTATAVLETGVVEKREGRQCFSLEAPAGLVQVEAQVENNVVTSVTCEGLPSYIDTHRARIEVPGLGEVTYSVAYSGGFYALVDASELGFDLVLEEQERLTACAHAIVDAIQLKHSYSHYLLGDVGPLPFLHFMGPVETVAPGRYRSRSTTYVHPRVICRSTTGTGTSARLALMHLQGDLKPGDSLETVSLRDTRFTGTMLGTHQQGTHRVLENTISGRSHVLNQTTINIDCEDPLIDCSDLLKVIHNAGT